jgi:hypothetical protein
MSTLLDRYRTNPVRIKFELFFDSRLFYSFTILLTLLCLVLAFNTRTLYFRMSALETCYNQTQIVPNCYDEHRCYNQTELQQCYADAGFKATEAHGIHIMAHAQKVLYIIYSVFLCYFVLEAITRFIMSPSNEFDALYDLAIIITDCVVSFSAIMGSDSFIYFGIALPVRVALFIADVEILRPTFYRLSLSVPKLLYFGLLFFSLMYFCGMATFLLFSNENNPACESCAKYFPDLQRSLITMLEVSMWYNWGEVVEALIGEKLFSEIFILTYFVLFGVVTTFVLFNVFYAVICEIILDYSNYNKKIPKNASTSFLNRVLLQLLFQFVEIMLTDEDQKRIENEDLTTTERLRIFLSAIRRYYADFLTGARSIFSNKRTPENEALVNSTECYGTQVQQTEEEEVDLAAIMKQLQELTKMVKSIDDRVRSIEEKMN